MGEDRRQADRRQNSTGDRRGVQNETSTATKEKKEPIIISLKTFIISILVVLVLIAGMFWYILHQVRTEIDDMQYYDEDYIYDEDFIDDTDDDDLDYEEDLSDETTSDSSSESTNANQ